MKRAKEILPVITLVTVIYVGISWGLFGLVVGVLTGLISGGGGLLGSITSGVTLQITWGVFGIVAGALAALVVYRAIPANRLRKMSALFSQTQADTSVILVLVDEAYTQKMTSDLSTHDAKGLIIRVTPSSSKSGLELAVSNTV